MPKTQKNTDRVEQLCRRLGQLVPLSRQLDNGAADAGKRYGLHSEEHRRLDQAFDTCNAEIEATEDMIAALPATTLAGAMVQVAIAHGQLDLIFEGANERIQAEAFAKTERLLRSAYRAMARSAGAVHDESLASSYFPVGADPFADPAPVLAKLRGKAAARAAAESPRGQLATV